MSLAPPVMQQATSLGTSLTAFRWYFPSRTRRWIASNAADPDGQKDRFSRWIYQLKYDRTPQRSEIAVELFTRLLCAIWDEFLHSPELIIAAPAHESYATCPEYPLKRVAARLCEMKPQVTDFSHGIRRTTSLPSAVNAPQVRDVLIQEQSLDLIHDPPSNRRILLLDDVTTSGATLEALAGILIAATGRAAAITAFAFGQTQRNGLAEFPLSPLFPDPDCIVGVDDLEDWPEQRAEFPSFDTTSPSDHTEQAPTSSAQAESETEALGPSPELAGEMTDWLSAIDEFDPDGERSARWDALNRRARLAISAEFSKDKDGDYRSPDEECAARITDGSVANVYVAGCFRAEPDGGWEFCGWTADLSAVSKWIEGDHLPVRLRRTDAQILTAQEVDALYLEDLAEFISPPVEIPF